MSSKKNKHSARRKPSKASPKLPPAAAAAADADDQVDDKPAAFLERFDEPAPDSKPAEIDGPAESADDCRVHWVWRLSAWFAGL